MNMKSKQFKCAILFAIIACTLSACELSPDVEITNLRCEYLNNPAGIDVPRPRFSWNIAARKRGVSQTAYRIIVSDNEKDISQKRGNCWDSGETESGATFQIACEGEKLRSAQTYCWRVCSRIDGREVWSKPATFHTGLFEPNDWKAQWISADEDIIDASPLLRHEFTVEKKIREAYIYASAAGVYELFLNGRRVGDDVLNPSISDYRKTLLYSVYDATALLKKGDNAFGVMLGNSAYNLHKVNGRYGWTEHPPMGKPRFMMQLKIVYDDGGEELIVTGEQWKYASGYISFNNIFGGEDCDARKEPVGWTAAGFDDAAWRKVATVESPGGQLRWQAVPIQITETLAPVAQTKPSKGIYLYDLGQNIAGWWRINVKGEAGLTIRIRGAETLNNALYPKNLEAGDKLSDKFAYHSQVWTDYTLKGGDSETYEPHFFYTGFRYIEVAVPDDKELSELAVEGRVVRSATERNGEWTSSDTLLNRIYEAGLWSQKANTVGYPTDCPHREKGAYTGDGQAIAETAMHDFLMAPFYYKWLNDMRDAQQPDGKIPNTTPPIVGGMGGGIGWGSAYILIPFWMYQFYDDRQILAEHYPTMKRYVEWLQSIARNDEQPNEPYIINYFDGYWYSLGEWCAPGQSDCPNHAVVNTFYYYYDVKLMSQIAAALGHADDASRYAALCDTVKQEFNRKFFSPQTLLYGMDSTVYQTYQLLALVGDLVPEEYRAGVVNTVVDDIKRRDNHLNTGIFGTKYLWAALSDNGYHDLAYSVATQRTYPSYGFWLDRHSTTLLEQWDGQNSHNHQMFGSITEYFYRYLSGIRNAENGYRSILLSPVMPDGLWSANASLQTMPGTVVSGWERRSDGSYSYHATVPANTSATLVLPVKGFRSPRLTESNKTVWQNNAFVSGVSGITDIVSDGDASLRLSLASGEYRFAVSEE